MKKKNNMALLKEDGSLDIEHINCLPYEEFMDAIGSLTEAQMKEYISKLPVDDSNEPMRAVKVDYRMGEDGVVAFSFINKMREKYLKKT